MRAAACGGRPHLEPETGAPLVGPREHRLPGRRIQRHPGVTQPQRQRAGQFPAAGDPDQVAARQRIQLPDAHAPAVSQAQAARAGPAHQHRAIAGTVPARGAHPLDHLAALDRLVPVQRADQPQRREHRPCPRPLGHRRRQRDRGHLPASRPDTRQLHGQKRRRLAEPHPGEDKKVGEQAVPLVVTAPP